MVYRNIVQYDTTMPGTIALTQVKVNSLFNFILEELFVLIIDLILSTQGVQIINRVSLTSEVGFSFNLFFTFVYILFYTL